MSRTHHLKLLSGEGQGTKPERRQEELQVGGVLHTLHEIVPLPRASRPELADYCLRSLSRPGEVIFDPFCGGGTYPLQATLLNRTAYGSDSDPLALLIAGAKLRPVGLDEVVLRLNQIDFNRPVRIGKAWERLEPFYHPDTLRELVNLRSYIAERPDRVNRVIELLVVSRLHGHTHSYLSTYTSPHAALDPERQLLVNRKRRSDPQYRSVAPRIIRRAAEVLEDGFSSEFFHRSDRSVLELSDSRRLQWLPADSVDLIATAPPLVGEAGILEGDWIARWFTGCDRMRHDDGYAGALSADGSAVKLKNQEAWRELMRATLNQLLRVLKPGRYAAFELPDCETENGRIAYDELLVSILPHVEWRERRFVADEIVSVDQVVGAREKRRPGRSTESSVVRNKLAILRSNERTRWTPRTGNRG